MSAATAGTAEERAKAAIANILKCIIEMPHLCSAKERALAKRISPPRDESLCAVAERDPRPLRVRLINRVRKTLRSQFDPDFRSAASQMVPV